GDDLAGGVGAGRHGGAGGGGAAIGVGGGGAAVDGGQQRLRAAAAPPVDLVPRRPADRGPSEAHTAGRGCGHGRLPRRKRLAVGVEGSDHVVVRACAERPGRGGGRGERRRVGE